MDRTININNDEYETNQETAELIQKIKAKPYSAGLPITRKGKPTIYSLEKQAKETKNKVYINKKAEWLFLCGRDVFWENVAKDDSEKDIFLVQNELDENLGLGKKDRKGKKIIIKNLKDRGDFLRRER